MSTFLDDTFGPITQDLIGLFGKSITFTRVAGGRKDPATGTVSGGSVGPLTVSAIIEAVKGSEVTDGLIQVGDLKLSIAGADLAQPPEPNDTSTVDGAVLTVIRVVPIYSGADVALWQLFCRRS